MGYDLDGLYYISSPGEESKREILDKGSREPFVERSRWCYRGIIEELYPSKEILSFEKVYYSLYVFDFIWIRLLFSNNGE